MQPLPEGPAHSAKRDEQRLTPDFDALHLWILVDYLGIGVGQVWRVALSSVRGQGIEEIIRMIVKIRPLFPGMDSQILK